MEAGTTGVTERDSRGVIVPDVAIEGVSCGTLLGGGGGTT